MEGEAEMVVINWWRMTSSDLPLTSAGVMTSNCHFSVHSCLYINDGGNIEMLYCDNFNLYFNIDLCIKLLQMI